VSGPVTCNNHLRGAGFLVFFFESAFITRNMYGVTKTRAVWYNRLIGFEFYSNMWSRVVMWRGDDGMTTGPDGLSWRGAGLASVERNSASIPRLCIPYHSIRGDQRMQMHVTANKFEGQ
jgi:hypothetical protein